MLFKVGYVKLGMYKESTKKAASSYVPEFN